MKIFDNERIQKNNLLDGCFYFIANKKKYGFWDEKIQKFVNPENKNTFCYEDATPFYCTNIYHEIGKDFDFDKELFSKVTEDILGKRLNYSGLFIEEKERALILSKFSDYIDENWKIHCHHLTSQLGKIHSSLKCSLGETFDITITGIGKDEKLGVVALRCDTEIFSDNKIKHITLAVAEKSKPFLSNKISNWKSVDNFKIQAKFGFVTKNGFINTSKKSIIKKNKP